MELFLRMNGNRIIQVSEGKTENSDEIKIDINSSDEFENYVDNNCYVADETIMSTINDIFNQDNSSDLEFKIKHWVINRSIGELIDMFENGEIIKPSMQRSLVWDSAKCSKLIESVIIGLPIPALFMMEIENGKYEIIDGLQRLSTFTNYVCGYSWGSDKTKRSAKLSGNVFSAIAGKAFIELSDDQKRLLKRSTIPVIEFKQLEPSNMDAKYLIFERINTGSIKLTEMQIRKALAHGTFIDNLYEVANANKKFVSLFSSVSIRNDLHVEAFLRILAITEIYQHNFETKANTIGKMLNAYCDSKKNTIINSDIVYRFNRAIDILFDAFNGDTHKICCKYIKDECSGHYVGSIQITILESLVGTIMSNTELLNPAEAIKNNYETIMSDVFIPQPFGMSFDHNPFTYSTGSREAIDSRYRICERILLCN